MRGQERDAQIVNCARNFGCEIGRKLLSVLVISNVDIDALGNQCQKLHIFLSVLLEVKKIFSYQ